MTSPGKPPRGGGALIVLLFFTPVASGADVTSAATVEPTAVRLSESVRVVLSIEGDTPLRVELPKEILDDQSAANWRARPDGPAAVTDLPGGRQRWAQAYRVDPYQPGEAVHLGFAPAQAFAGKDPQPKEITWQATEVKVTTGVKGESAAEARPPTGIEELPPVGTQPTSIQDRLAVLLALAVGVVVIAVAAVWLVRRRPPPRPTPEEWAAARLDELAVGSAPDGEFADRLSDVVRRFVEARTRVPATKLTTAEVPVELERSGDWPADRVAELVAVLDRCDRVKFAADRPTAEEAADLLELARRVVTPPAAPPP